MRWGILSTGNIAKQFARGLSALPDHQLVAVGSRSQESADRFGDEFNVPHRHSSYEALAQDAEVDAIYIGTPHVYHAENSLLCLRNGKAVLCEKPFAINATQAKEVIDYARENNIFLMEAMWTRFLPLMVRLRELLAQGVIGEVRMVNADFGFRMGWNPQHRLLNPDLGGGALLDVGIYPVSLASMIFGKPNRITSMAHLGETGVDEQSAIIFGYDDGELAILHTAIRSRTQHRAIITGTEGDITIHPAWWKPTRMTVNVFGKETTEIEMPFDGNGYNYEAEEVARCVADGLTESPTMPLDETLQLMHTLDEIRAQWGLKYPME